MTNDLSPPPEGTISDADFREYIQVINAALLIHYERERVRQGLWKEYEAKDQVNSIKIKADRLSRSFEILARAKDPDLREELLENMAGELYDIINYSNFAVRQLK